MKRLLGVAILAGVALSAPASAQAATFAADKPCYAAGDTATFTGAGYTPNGTVQFAENGEPLMNTATADEAGNFSFTLVAPRIQAKKPRPLALGATDQSNPANTATARVRFSRLFVGITPKSGRSSRVRRIRAVGFTETGRTLYMHVRRKGRRGRVRDVRLGRLQGPCKKVSARRRLFKRSTAAGRYRIVFDTARRLQTERRQGYFIDFRIRRIRVPDSSAAGAAASSAQSRMETTVTGSGIL